MPDTSTQTRLLAGFLCLVAGAGVAQSPAQPYRYAPPAAWVQVARDVGLEDPRPVEDGHSDYLLADHQVRLSSVTSHYVRYVERLTTQAAVDRSAQVSVQIDPGHEIAWLHEVRVLRNGRAIDKLADARRSLLNREEDLENGLLNGRVTLHLLLQDVRVGDVLDYSYTLERRDPFGERGYHDWFATQWGEPLRRLRIRVLSPVDRPLVVRDFGGLGAPRKSQRDGWVETVWLGRDRVSLPNEEARPNWHTYYPRIEISEFADWNAVRDWARPMYRVARRDDPRLRQLVADVRAAPDDAARVLKALRFVQDDVRYTGIEIGAGAFRPTQPASVLARRYGDCKDKTLLLITVLRELGIEAWPALVHSSQRHALIDRAPGPGAFDHVIAKVRLAGKDYWLDATASGQGGSIDELVQANFGPALVIDDSRHGLELMPTRQPAEPTHQVTETFDLRAGISETARLKVLTEYRQDAADGMRARMRTQTATQLGKDYLEYYRKTYAGIRMAKPLRIEDDRDRNVYRIHESYDIDQPYEKSDEGGWRFYLAAYLISERARKPDTLQRSTPLARTFPMHVRHEIVAYLPSRYQFTPDVVEVRDPAFRYQSRVKYQHGELRLEYELRATADHVPASRIAEYAKNLESVYNDAFFTLTDAGPPKKATVAAAAKPRAGGPPAPSGPGLVPVASGVGGLILGGWLGWLLARSRGQAPVLDEDAPSGLEGWLLLVGGVAVFLPLLAVFFGSVLLREHGSAADFASLGGWQQWLQGGLLAACGALAALGGLGILLLRRHVRTFPLLMQAQLALVVIVLGLLMLQHWRTGVLAVSGVTSLIATLLAVLACGACAAYLARSRRVRATFVNHFLPNSASSAARAASASPVGAT